MVGLAIILILVVGLILFLISPGELDEQEWQQFNEEMAYRTGEDWPNREEQ